MTLEYFFLALSKQKVDLFLTYLCTGTFKQFHLYWFIARKI